MMTLQTIPLLGRIQYSKTFPQAARKWTSFLSLGFVLCSPEQDRPSKFILEETLIGAVLSSGGSHYRII